MGTGLSNEGSVVRTWSLVLGPSVVGRRLSDRASAFRRDAKSLLCWRGRKQIPRLCGSRNDSTLLGSRDNLFADGSKNKTGRGLLFRARVPSEEKDLLTIPSSLL